MVNLIYKFHALMVSEEIQIWHFGEPAKGIKPFIYFMAANHGDKHEFDDLTSLIEAAYARIDPLKKPLPTIIKEPIL